MAYELTGNPISSTYTRLVQCVSSNYYDGLGNRLDLVHNSSLGLFVAKAGDTMTGDLTINANLDVSTGDAASGAILGNAFVGVWNGNTSYATFCHKNQRYNTNNYAFIQNANGHSWFNAAAGGQLSFNIGAGGKMKLFSSGGFSVGSTFYNIDPGSNNLAVQGKIGIGTYEPAATLDVRGNANIDGSLYINSGGVTVKGNTTNDRLVVDTGLNFTPVARPAASSIDVSVLAVPGNIDAGLHSYSYSFVTPLGETELMNSAPVGEYTFDASNGQALLTVPVSTDYRVTARKIYRSAADVYKYTVYHIATIADNTTTTYIDNLPDSTLSGAPGYYRPNTTSEQLKYNGLTMGMVGDFITLFGRNAGAAMIAGGGYMNTLIGPNAGATITTGSMNTAIGYNALSKLVTGSGGVAIGEMAGYNVTGSNNVIIGNYAFNGMSGAISGASNVVIGARAGYSASGSAANNVMLGQYSGYNTTGNYNLYLGYYAGYRTTGSNNIIIDTIARANASTEKTDAPIFGETSATRANQRLYLGGGGKVGINTITPTTTLDVSGSFNVNGNIYVDGSVGFTGDVSVGQTMRFKNGILIQVL